MPWVPDRATPLVRHDGPATSVSHCELSGRPVAECAVRAHLVVALRIVLDRVACLVHGPPPVQVDQEASMVVEIVDPEGRFTAWNSWDGEVSGGSLPRCKLGGILISQVASRETAPYIAYTLSSLIPGKYQIRIRALNSFQASLDVQRERNGWSPWCGASDTALMHRGRLASWVVHWSPSSAESCWVDLSGPGGRRALVEM